MYRYETHLHTAPASACARCSVKDNVDFYARAGYAGIFVTNHFVDGNIGAPRDLPYADKIDFYERDYTDAVECGREVGLSVFFGVELSYGGTDFLVYGLDAAWYRAHPEIMEMKKSDELRYLREAGGLSIQAHPYREAAYIDHIRLFPRCVEGVEVINACRTDLENRMAEAYAEAYGLFRFAGTDNHRGAEQPKLAGVGFDVPIEDVGDFVRRLREGGYTLFCEDNPRL